MAVSGKKINELEAVVSLTDNSVLPIVIVDNNTPEPTAKKVTVKQLVGDTLPDQTGQAGKVLTTDGNTASWQDPTGGVTSVNGETGAVILTGEDINVDSNTATTIDVALEEKQIAPTIITDGNAASLAVQANTIYQFNTISALNITSFENSYDESVIYFTSGSSGTTVTTPAGLNWIGGSAPTFSSSTQYIISICNGLAVASLQGGGGSSFDPTSVDGYDATAKQMLINNTGTLKWVGLPTITYYTDNTGNTITIADTTNALLVKIYKNGALLQEGVSNDYTISGTTLTLTTALVSTDKIATEII